MLIYSTDALCMLTKLHTFLTLTIGHNMYYVINFCCVKAFVQCMATSYVAS